ncbi:MAG: amidohydrolase [Candidatus Aminicenantaceae bacterium]
MTKRSISLRILSLGLLVSCFLLASCTLKKEAADLVLTNGKIMTMDNALPEAEALAVRDGSIVAVGNSADIQAYVGEATEVIDLDGKLAIPGFIDAHVHFTSIGQAKLGLELMPVKNWDEILSLVEAAVAQAEPGEWIIGRGWHQEKWDTIPDPNVDGLPLHNELSRLSPDNPVLLSHASGHSSFANAKAMELAGITKSTPDPPGGEIVKDTNGNLVGVFRETAQWFLREARNEYHEKRSDEVKEAERRQVVEIADKECLSKGITGVHDAGSPFETVDLFKEFVTQGKLGVRLYVMVREPNDRLAERISDYWIEGLGDNHLTVRSIKLTIDGALGPHGAWLLEPYTSLPTSVGLNTNTVEYTKETARIAIEKGFQFNVHCIGDRANQETLNIYESTFQAFPDKADLRWRIEHAQHLHPDDIPRFGELSVIPSMQGIHCTSDGPYVLKRLGEKRAEEGAYMWRALMETGAIICNGTDAPVEDVDPLPCFYGTVTRRMLNGELFYPDQKMTREEALRSYTLNAAYAAFQEDILGSLETGKLGDVTVLSKDIMVIPEDEILTAEVLYTIVGGKVLYRR